MENEEMKIMTAKRFTLTTTEFDGTLSFYDAEYDCETRMSTEYVLDKVEITLNHLHEENEQLQHDATILIQANQDYRKENESLKEENKFLRNKVATYKKGNALLKKTLDKEWK